MIHFPSSVECWTRLSTEGLISDYSAEGGDRPLARRGVAARGYLRETNDRDCIYRLVKRVSKEDRSASRPNEGMELARVLRRPLRWK